jgi:Flp pilus assembly protein TadG
MRRKIASQDGAAMVEFAILFIPLMIITFGIIEFGIAVYDNQVITNASREGAKAGIAATVPRLPLNGTPSITSVVTDYCSNNLIAYGSDGNLTIRAVVIDDDKNIRSIDTARWNDNLIVTVQYNYSYPVISKLIPELTKNLEAVTSMKYQ